MLVLSRKVGERIWIGPDISVTIVRIAGGAVRLGINAPPELAVVREELKERIEAEQALADAQSIAVEPEVQPQ
jgi:carbon storage regulator